MTGAPGPAGGARATETPAGTAQSGSPAARRLERRLAWLGAVSFASFAAATLLSHGLAPLAPFVETSTHETAVYAARARDLAWLGRAVADYLAGRTTFADRPIFVLAWALPLLASTAVFIALVRELARCREALNEAHVRRVFRWAVAFVLISVPAEPVLFSDFWVGLARGRMLADGLNPYHADMPAALVADLPLDRDPNPTPYGPLWSLTTGVVMTLVGGHAVLGALALKLLFACAWVGALALLRRTLAASSPWERAFALAVVGWLPLGITQGVAEGHNDTLLVFLLVLWLYLLERGRGFRASLALTASVLMKYATAPLFLLDLLHHPVTRGERLTRYAPRAAAAAALMAAGIAAFYRSPQFFATLLDTRSWRYYSLVDAFWALETLLRISWFPSSLTRALFPLLAVWLVARYVRAPTRQTFADAVGGILCAVIFGALTYVNPWYGLWLLAPAALAAGSSLSRWAIGFALAAPFPVIMWIVYLDAGDWWVFGVPALALYAAATLWWIAAPRGWFSHAASAGRSTV